MTRNALSCSALVVPLVLAAALFIGAIIAQDFWLSLALGIVGVGSSLYGAFLLREPRKGLPDGQEQSGDRMGAD